MYLSTANYAIRFSIFFSFVLPISTSLVAQQGARAMPYGRTYPTQIAIILLLIDNNLNIFDDSHLQT